MWHASAIRCCYTIGFEDMRTLYGASATSFTKTLFRFSSVRGLFPVLFFCFYSMGREEMRCLFSSRALITTYNMLVCRLFSISGILHNLVFLTVQNVRFLLVISANIPRNLYQQILKYLLSKRLFHLCNVIFTASI